jgi:hypothetical protein
MNTKEQIKRELYKSYLILVRNLFQQSQPTLDAPKIGEIRKRFLIGSTIFLAFSMESFINDFGEQYVEDFDDLEKMESLTKYLLFPKLAKDNPAVIIKKSEHSYEALKLLFRYRNYFAHHKPAFRGTTSGEEQLYAELDHEKVQKLYVEMIKIFKAFNNQFHMFEDGDDWITDYSEDINAGT